MIWLYGIIAASVVGLILIFAKRRKKVNDLEKIKMHVNEDKQEIVAKSKTKRNKKKKEVDYKLIANIFNKADLLLSQGKPKEAEKGFVHVLSINPDHVDSNLKLGLLYLKNEKFSKAEEIFKHIIALKSDRAAYYTYLAKAFYGQQKLEEARSNYETAVRLRNDDVDSFVNLGHIYAELSIDKPAINAYSKALSLNPKLTNVYFLMADLLIKVDALSEAAACIQTLLESHPYDEKAKEKLREIKIKMGVDPLKGAPVKLPQRSKNIRDMIEEAEKNHGGEQQSLL